METFKAANQKKKKYKKANLNFFNNFASVKPECGTAHPSVFSNFGSSAPPKKLDNILLIKDNVINVKCANL